MQQIRTFEQRSIVHLSNPMLPLAKIIAEFASVDQHQAIKVLENFENDITLQKELKRACKAILTIQEVSFPLFPFLLPLIPIVSHNEAIPQTSVLTAALRDFVNVVFFALSLSSFSLVIIFLLFVPCAVSGA
jgi:hypothetical protein